MTTAYIHVGGAHAGSTTIQEFLRANRAVLASRGVAVFPSGKPFAALTGGADALAAFEQLAAHDVRERGAHTVVVSDERFSGPSLTPELAGRCAELFGSLCDRVVVIYYLRRQDEAVLSAWSRGVAKGRLAEPVAPPPDVLAWGFQARLAVLREAFGRDNIQARRFGRSYFPEGDLLSDFANATGLELAGLQKPPPQNTSLDAQHLEYLWRYNSITPAPKVKKLVRLGVTAAPQPGPRAGLSRDMREAILTPLEPSNRRVAEEFFGEAGPLFTHDIPDDAPPPLTTEQVLAITAEVMAYASEFVDRERLRRFLGADGAPTAA